jgi:hypothetical protein
MDTLPLPPRPNVEQYRKRAKDLVAIAQRGDDAAVRAWASDWLTALAKLLDAEITPFVQDSFDRAVETIAKRVLEKRARGPLALADAQFLIAQAHGFPDWGAFVAHIEGPRDAKDKLFEEAADAVVVGDLSRLRALVTTYPELVRARSARVHRVTLLHYVAANGVEDFRQKTPPNAVEIGRLLLDNGAEVDAVADTYGGGQGQTTMNLLVSSTHPNDAGLQSALAELLLDYGAAINGLENDGSPIMTAIGFWYGDTAATLARRGARLDNVVAAACVGRLDVVKRMVIDRQTLSPEVRIHDTVWFKLPADAKTHIEWAAATAAHYRRTDVLDHLLGIGVSPFAKDKDDMTLLHWAGAVGDIPLIERLVKAGAPLEAVNTWGGTVLDSTAHFAFHGPRLAADYLTTMRALIELGADARVLREYPPGNAAIDSLKP